MSAYRILISILAVMTVYCVVLLSNAIYEPSAEMPQDVSQGPFRIIRNHPVFRDRQFDRVQLALSRLDVFQEAKPAPMSTVLHGMHLNGTEGFFLTHPEHDEPQAALDVVLKTELASAYFPNGSPLVSTRYGVRCRTLERRNSAFQREREAHQNQLIAVLAEEGIPLAHPVSTLQQEATVGDILTDLLSNYSSDEPELEWTAAALGIYLPPSKGWTDKYGVEHDFDELVTTLLALDTDDPNRSCFGTHVLYSATVIWQSDRKHGILSPRVRSVLSAQIEDWASRARRSQAPNGAWSGKWKTGRDDHDAPPLEHLIATSHMVEWMMLLPPELQITDDQYSRAADWLIDAILSASDREIRDHYCPYSHAGFCARRLLEAPAPEFDLVHALNMTELCAPVAASLLPLLQ